MRSRPGPSPVRPHLHSAGMDPFRDTGRRSKSGFPRSNSIAGTAAATPAERYVSLLMTTSRPGAYSLRAWFVVRSGTRRRGGSRSGVVRMDDGLSRWPGDDLGGVVVVVVVRPALGECDDGRDSGPAPASSPGPLLVVLPLRGDVSETDGDEEPMSISTPVTSAPARAAGRARLPVPQGTSSTRAPGASPSRPTNSAARDS
jgi:hypothetical protein